MKIVIALFLTLLAVNLKEVHTLNILGIFAYQGKSHFFVFEPYLRELVKRGHSVTVISNFPLKQPLENYTDISLADKRSLYENVVDMEQTAWTSVKLMKMLWDTTLENCRVLVEEEKVQHLVKSRTKFDLVVVEAFLGDCSLGLAHKLGAPVVGLNSHVVLPMQYDRHGIPHPLLKITPNPDFLSRFLLTALFEVFNWINRWYQNAEQAILAEYFDDIPPLEELGQDIKLLLAYTHYSMFGPQAWPENVKEVGGYHVAKPKPLSEKLKKIIEESEHGVIYVSFGSMVKSTSLPPHKLEAMIAALSQLPQRVIWKWDKEHLPGNPKNIYVSKWLPQNDILAHPNVVAFYSHGGLLGSTEAIHHGVPTVFTPVFAEQPINAYALELKGFGVQMPYSGLTKEALLEKFRIILDPEFRRRAKEISREWHDRPMTPMDTAIYWTEYVARHPNSSLRIAAVGKPQYQLYGLDVLLAFFVVSILCLYVFVFVVKYLIFGKRTKSKKD